MIYKKFIVIFLLILSIFSVFSFSSVHAENINVINSNIVRMQSDIDFFKRILKNNNINNMNDLKSFIGASSIDQLQYFYVEAAGHTYYQHQYVCFYNSFAGITYSDNFSYYQIGSQRAFTLDTYYRLRWNVSDGSGFTSANDNTSLTAPICWLGVRTVDLFSLDSSQIVANAVGNVNNSVNTLNGKLTEDNSNQDDINLGTHNDEMNNASDTIKNSNLYSKFDKILKDLDYSFTYNDDEVETLPITFYGKSYVLRSDELSSFFKNNGLGFVVTLWQSIMWFSLLYTMFLFIRKLYKSFVGGNPVDEVSSTLSSEDNKIIGGF